MEYYSSMKGNGLLIHATNYMDLKDIMPNKNKKPVPQSYTLYGSICITFSKQKKCIKNKLVLARGQGMRWGVVEVSENTKGFLLWWWNGVLS